LAISRSFFNLPDDTLQQRTTIRKKAFHYIKESLIDELDEILKSNGIIDYEIEFVTENSSAMVATVEVKYKSMITTIDYVSPVVKIEFSAMSLDEPYQEKEITTLINSVYPVIDNEIKCLFKAVVPERTFLEKLFLLHEEYQKDKPRTTRMSRHLYDLGKIMDTSFGTSALQNTDLYKTVVNHRKKFNKINGIDYQRHYPAFIQICPPINLTDEWENDYRQLQHTFIYEESKSFSELINQLQDLTDEIRKITFAMQ